MEIVNEIYWYLESSPSIDSVQMKVDIYGRRDITEEEYKKVVSEKDMKLRMYLNNKLKYWKDIVIEGPVTVETLVGEIYDFYQLPLDDDDFDKAFEKCECVLDELSEEYGDDLSGLINYDVFSKDPDATFEGLEEIEEGYWGLMLGPL